MKPWVEGFRNLNSQVRLHGLNVLPPAALVLAVSMWTASWTRLPCDHVTQSSVWAAPFSQLAERWALQHSCIPRCRKVNCQSGTLAPGNYNETQPLMQNCCSPKTLLQKRLAEFKSAWICVSARVKSTAVQFGLMYRHYTANART